MKAKTGFEAWRERNLPLPFPDEYRIMCDGSLKVIWDRLEKDWYRAHVEFTWGPDGALVARFTPRRDDHVIVFLWAADGRARRSAGGVRGRCRHPRAH